MAMIVDSHTEIFPEDTTIPGCLLILPLFWEVEAAAIERWEAGAIAEVDIE